MIFPERFLAGQVAIVTGGGTGIGKETARVFGALGARVVIVGRRPEVLAEAARELEEAPGVEVTTVQTDVREPEQVEAMVRTTVERFGRIDVLVNNAGANFICPSVSLTPRGWRSVMGTIADGTFYCSRYAGEHMVAARSGQIVNVVTPYAELGAPGLAPSASGKAAVVTLTKTLAAEWAPFGVRVNAVSPGAVDSEGAGSRLWPTESDRQKVISGIPLGRMATPLEVARVIAWLVSPFAAYITGAILPMDGGHSLGRGILGFLRD